MHLKSALASSPISRAVIDANAHFTYFSLADVATLFRAQGHEGPVGMEYGQVTLEVVDEVEFHLRKLGIVRGERLDAILLEPMNICGTDPPNKLHSLLKRLRASETTFLICTGDSSALAAT